MVLLLSLLLAFTDWSTIIKPALKQVPRLEALREGAQAPTICSAVLFNKADGYAITAAHCVEKPQGEWIAVTVAGRHAEIQRVNRLLDLAVVRYDVKNEDQIELAEATPAVGSEIAIVGYPFGDGALAPTYGHVSQVLNDSMKLVWVNVDLIPGDSGGATIDLQGRLVGVNVLILYAGAGHMAAVVPVETVRDFVKPYLPMVKK